MYDEDTPSIAAVHTEQAIRQAKESSMPKRYRVEHADGNVSYIHPMPKPAPMPEPVHLTARQELCCAVLRWKASVARAEISNANARGIYATDSLLEFELQADRYEAKVSEIVARAAANPRKPPSIVKELIVGLGLIFSLCLAFHLWSK
jgi:hypothetical protein